MPPAASPAFLDLLQQVNVASKDNGHRFTERQRLDAILRLLSVAPTLWVPVHEGPLAVVFARKGAASAHPERPLLISSHIDALYTRFGHKMLADGRLQGSFDNAITNALLLHVMLRDELPPGTLVAFTGDEEYQSRGADEVMAWLQDTGRAPQAVVVLDITDETVFRQRAFTIENWFAGASSNPRAAEATFLKSILQALPTDEAVHTVHHEDSMADETWQYDEHKVPCFALCLPSAPADELGPDADWMHDDAGVCVWPPFFEAYAEALRRIAQHLGQAHPWR